MPLDSESCYSVCWFGHTVIAGNKAAAKGDVAVARRRYRRKPVP